MPVGISNYIHYEVWDEITHPFPNFKGCTVEVWEGIISPQTLLGMCFLIHVRKMGSRPSRKGCNEHVGDPFTYMHANPSGAVTKIFRENYLNTVVVDPMAPFVTRPSAAPVFSVQHRRILYFHEVGFQLPTSIFRNYRTCKFIYILAEIVTTGVKAITSKMTAEF